MKSFTKFVATGNVSASRDTVNQFLARDEVRQAILGQGVTAQAALARVAAMSDNEVAQLAGRTTTPPCSTQATAPMRLASARPQKPTAGRF